MRNIQKNSHCTLRIHDCVLTNQSIYIAYKEQQINDGQQLKAIVLRKHNSRLAVYISFVHAPMHVDCCFSRKLFLMLLQNISQFTNFLGFGSSNVIKYRKMYKTKYFLYLYLLQNNNLWISLHDYLQKIFCSKI